MFVLNYTGLFHSNKSGRTWTSHNQRWFTEAEAETAEAIAALSELFREENSLDTVRISDLRKKNRPLADKVLRLLVGLKDADRVEVMQTLQQAGKGALADKIEQMGGRLEDRLQLSTAEAHPARILVPGERWCSPDPDSAARHHLHRRDRVPHGVRLEVGVRELLPADAARHRRRLVVVEPLRFPGPAPARPFRPPRPGLTGRNGGRGGVPSYTRKPASPPVV